MLFHHSKLRVRVVSYYNQNAYKHDLKCKPNINDDIQLILVNASFKKTNGIKE